MDNQGGGGSSAPPPQQDWQSPPQQPSAPPPGGGQPPGSGQPEWMGNLTSTQPVAGPAGFFYADVPNRVFAMIIDVIAMIVIQFVLVAILAGGALLTGGFQAMALVANLVAFVIWGAYFIYTWSTMRGTLGMKALGLQVGHQADGRSLTYQQSAIRFGVLFGPQIVLGLLGALIPALAGLGLLSFVWLVVILVTMAQSPTKQGLHDKYAESMVVKAGRAIGS
ncbi:hypothetical protein BH23CHL7_BH23CHL7_00060 [soil metagenome]